jgi:hypothetical protein
MLWSQFSAISDHFRPFSTIIDHFRPFSTIFDHFQPFSTILTIFDHFRPFSTIIDHFQPFSTITYDYIRRKKLAFFSKTSLMIKILEKLAICSLSKKRQFFGEKYF